eukprot:CAMPEP_0202466614 /NCGR_PEP_ID=MMETSP1360-20130828/69310_1 /ASSEMBLY_ACC=CAM_ASM_000848 /TAXON_ID=515479 /ORGANISM="Licmophora paradoxa, Strain CCMP2313" /LENGTH=350 /DNA_ID=CAMNT_0049090819 /DNA_START=63 /DNA_END=1115 /DNA_ORIENTATION=-
MTRSTYQQIANDHPGSVGKILKNLLDKVERMAEEKGINPRQHLTTTLSLLNAGSEFDESIDNQSFKNNDPTEAQEGTETNSAATRKRKGKLEATSEGSPDDIDISDMGNNSDLHGSVGAVQTFAAMTSIRELITMHIHKQKDDHTTRFLFAASRGDIPTIRRMCDQGFDPNSSDYDSRTGLMVAAMKGNTDVVKKMLEYHANPNLVDMHGTSALFEATRNGHENTIRVLMNFGAKLMMEPHFAASTLCQAVFEGDILFLRRLLKSGIAVDAHDYDKRTAIHIAAAEGNVAAVRALVENGANLHALDRWNNTVYDEAKSANAGKVLEYLDGLEWYKSFREAQEEEKAEDKR